ncbi:tetratricopeptide repeat-containing sulfotransferase family protein [Marilutibacter aestuarii]|uniref:Sulfotransferase n=1 Tax=Marilutibacter aestuarii TaxID=1706195 RepID=A0A508AJY9_9GAMM|nr:sulfotransferase [Lysobacter aestuarii]TQD48891.1 sulfotransferase [Lysobacter aestuarii]
MPQGTTIDIHGYPLPAALGPHWQRGMALAGQGDMAAAAACMQAIVDARPDFLPGRLQQAHFLLGADRYRDALAIALDLADCMPASLEFAWHLVRLLRRFELHEQVAGVVSRSGWEQSWNAEGLCRLASQLGPIGLYGPMEAILERLSALGSVDVNVHVLRGTVALVSGDTGAAAHHLRRALAEGGDSLAHVRWMLTLHEDATHADADRHATEVELERVRPGSEDEAYLAFALHNLLHAAGDVEGAWVALERGCRIKRQAARHDDARQERLFQALATAPLPDAPPDEAPEPGPRPVFIVGMFRSGTSVVERVLSGHPDVVDGGESYVMPAAMCAAADHMCNEIVDERMIQRIDAEGLRVAAARFRAHARWKAGGRAVFTEKLPSNFLLTGYILAAMPEARIVHMRRDPMDTCFSNLRTFFTGAAGYSYDQASLARYYLGYRALMAHWRERHPERILEVDYQAFVDDPEGQARRLLAFCGLEFLPSVLDVGRSGGYSATASIGSVRKGILRNRGGAWRAYAAHLQPLLEGLAPVLVPDGD